MDRHIEKKIKALISGILVNDTSKIDKCVSELTEAIIPSKETEIMNTIVESFKGETDV
jgi:hypothetical protein